MAEAFVYDAVRTPFGRHGGALAGCPPDDLAAHVVRALVDRAPALDPARVDEIVFGNANGAGEDNRNVARMAGLLAGLPVTVPAATVNRLCGSSLDAAMVASRQIALGEAHLVIVGGVESMTRAPWVLPKPDKPFPHGDVKLVSTTLGWRLVNPAMPAAWTVFLGEATEQLRERYGVSREDQDEFALRSHQAAAAAWDAGFYDNQVVKVPGADLDRDESIRPDTSRERLAALRPVFRADGTVTAGNASPLNDGASAALLGSEAAGEALGLSPLARIAGRGAGLRAAVLRVRARRGGQQRPRPGRHRLERRSRDRAQRGLRGPVPGVHPRLGRGSGHRERARRRDRDRAPAGRLGYADPGHPRPVAGRVRAALGRRGDLHRRRPGPCRGSRERGVKGAARG